MASTRRPRSARAAARLMAVVVLPTPPFPDTQAIPMPMVTSGLQMSRHRTLVELRPPRGSEFAPSYLACDSGVAVAPCAASAERGPVNGDPTVTRPRPGIGRMVGGSPDNRTKMTVQPSLFSSTDSHAPASTGPRRLPRERAEPR